MEVPRQGLLPDIRMMQVVDFPIQKVWEAIATSEGIAAWFMLNDFKPALGHMFFVDASPIGLIPCKVTLIDPPNRLSYEWGKDWLLTFELRDLDGQTELTVVHSGWDVNKVAESGRTHTVAHEKLSLAWTVLINRLVRRAIKK
ncbi:SRPBCC family protein [Paenibacillus nasutitermitis]|uniref:Activator of Hsp90 ATPase homologue 1/2-like C-terminal domain-containing protein n=1 Tax=Paenibacillus nasutitermitis TaxID=1652958 RepID=A0A917E2V5_9BACL|nr:hypothetical protein GCM10010911_65140 [Paenibacillus nasutitermitis]